jgi:hypothetical protein
MRLSDDKARQLNALVWRDRARRVLPLVAAAVAVAAVLTFFLVRQVERADKTTDVHIRQATVVHIKKSGNGRAAAIVEIRLDDGREAEAFSALRIDPQVGTHVVVSEARHASGRLTYDIARVAE